MTSPNINNSNAPLIQTSTSQTALRHARNNKRPTLGASKDTLTLSPSRTSIKRILIGAASALLLPRFIGGVSAAPIGGPRGLVPRDAYTVVAGDSLWNIAQSHGVSLSTLEAANPQISNPNAIQVGQVIEVPGTTSTSKGPLTATDALAQIAKIGGEIADIQSQIATAKPEDVPALQQKQSDLMTAQSDIMSALQNGGAVPTVAPQPTVVAPHPTAVAPQPTIVAPQPTVVAPQPTVVAPQPTVVAPQPTVVAPQPTVVAPQPTVVAPQPTSVASPLHGIITQADSPSFDAATVKAASLQGFPGFPDPSTWQSFDSMWSKAAVKMNTWPGLNGAPSNTAQQTNYIKAAILAEAGTSGVDSRIILATVMQESSGNVHVPTTANGVNNPGLMQSHNGATFDPNDEQGSIARMIQDGARGTFDSHPAGADGGPGLAQNIQKGGSGYVGMRLYNSGSADLDNLGSSQGATAAYVQQVSDKLLGNNGW